MDVDAPEDEDGLMTVSVLRSLVVEDPAAELEGGEMSALVLVALAPLRLDRAPELVFEPVAETDGEAAGEGRRGEVGAFVVALDQCDVGFEDVVVLEDDASEPIRVEDASDPVGEPDCLVGEVEDISARQRIGTAPISIVIVLRPVLEGYRR